MFDFSPEVVQYIEIGAVVTGLVFLLLVIKQNIWCWSFGIVTSLLSVLLFLEVALFSEAILYFFYAIMGVYGWIVWDAKSKENIEMPVSTESRKSHGGAIIVGLIASSGLGWVMSNFTKSEMSYVDSHTTIFSFLATYLETQKILSAWLYWIVINGVSVWLYYSRELHVYAWLMAFYFIMSFVGFYSWKKSYQKEVS